MNLTIRILTWSVISILLANCSEIVPDAENSAPEIQSITISPGSRYVNRTLELSCLDTDIDEDDLSYGWSADQGYFETVSDDSLVLWKAPEYPGQISLKVLVGDGSVTVERSIEIVIESNIFSGVDTTLGIQTIEDGNLTIYHLMDYSITVIKIPEDFNYSRIYT